MGNEHTQPLPSGTNQLRRDPIQAGAELSLGCLGQIHTHLLAPASADDRQIHGFARFGLAERALEFADIACSLRVDRDDELSRLADPALFHQHRA